MAFKLKLYNVLSHRSKLFYNIQRNSSKFVWLIPHKAQQALQHTAVKRYIVGAVYANQQDFVPSHMVHLNLVYLAKNLLISFYPYHPNSSYSSWIPRYISAMHYLDSKTHNQPHNTEDCLRFNDKNKQELSEPIRHSLPLTYWGCPCHRSSFLWKTILT